MEYARTKLLMTGIGVATVGGIAVAADSTNTVTAPYAQAARSVGPSHSHAQRTGTIASVSKHERGSYWVVPSSDIDAAKAVPVTPLSVGADWGSESACHATTAPARPTPSAFRVTIGTNGAAADQPFQLLVP